MRQKFNGLNVACLLCYILYLLRFCPYYKIITRIPKHIPRPGKTGLWGGQDRPKPLKTLNLKLLHYNLIAYILSRHFLHPMVHKMIWG